MQGSQDFQGGEQLLVGDARSRPVASRGLDCFQQVGSRLEKEFVRSACTFVGALDPGNQLGVYFFDPGYIHLERAHPSGRQG